MIQNNIIKMNEEINYKLKKINEFQNIKKIENLNLLQINYDLKYNKIKNRTEIIYQ